MRDPQVGALIQRRRLLQVASTSSEGRLIRGTGGYRLWAGASSPPELSVNVGVFEAAATSLERPHFTPSGARGLAVVCLPKSLYCV